MDYEQKYKEALERARDLMTKQNPPAFNKDLISLVFPELVESEDEKIRKNCIHFLELQKSHHASTVEIEECIVWLEKQGEKLDPDEVTEWLKRNTSMFWESPCNPSKIVKYFKIDFGL